MNANVQSTVSGLTVSGDMTLETAATLLAEGDEALRVGEPLCDLAGVENIDSSGLAVLFGWQRAAQSRGQALRIAHPPASLISLAEVYGVAELLSFT